MRYAVFSDIHANLEAFRAVLKDMEQFKPDKKIFLGDIIGYGPDPAACIDLLREQADFIIGGNHDWAAVGLTDTSYFNPYAAAAMEWSADQLEKKHKEYLQTLPVEGVFDDYQAVHSTPVYPTHWRYIFSMQDALDNHRGLTKRLCFIGHSHQPQVLEYLSSTSVVPHKSPEKNLKPDSKYIINAGSVGQPRDGDTRACYLLFDSKAGQIRVRRVAYDISAVQAKMAKAGLPPYLIERLSLGR